jgi:predicted permease
MPARLRSWLRSLLRRSRLERELDEEMRFHLESRVADLTRQGLSAAEAERRARLEFGSVDKQKERVREARGLRWPDELVQDLRFAFRGFRRDLGFTAVAVLTLALGIGVNTAMFTVVHSVLLHPLPYREPDRLVMVYSVGAFGPYSWWDGPFMDPEILEFGSLKSFSAVAAFGGGEVALTGPGDPARVRRGDVTAGLFGLLGVQPALGRTFLADATGERTAEVVLSDSLWRSRYQADPDVIGKVATLDGVPHTIVGVMPAGFDFPPEAVLWTRLTLRPDYWSNAFNKVIGRLADGVLREQGLAEVKSLLSVVEESQPQARRVAGVTVVDLRESMVGKVRLLLLVLLGAVGAVLLIASTNIANLLLARAAARGPEMAVRSSLGAGRARLVRQLLTESVALAGVGGLAGLLVANGCLAALLATIPPTMLPRVGEIQVHAPVLLFTFLVCLVTGVLFGLAPALTGSRRELIRQQPQHAGSGMGVGEKRVRGLLVVAETALVLVLLVGAGLLLKSFWRLNNVDPGFRRDRILTMKVSPPDRVYPTIEDKRVFYSRLLERLTSLPGIEETAAINLLPFGSLGWQGDFTVEGRDYEPAKLVVGKPAVSEGYFRMMGIPLRRGRLFDETDRQGAERVAIVSESVASACWPNQDPLGRRLTMDDPKEGRWLTVVGVVGEIRQSDLAAEPLPMIYVPQRQEYHSFFMASMAFLVRAPGDPRALAGALREQVRALDPELPVDRIDLLDRLIAGSLAEPRFRTALLLGFALLALVLALVGIYGVTAYEVARRRGEIGVRRALGAQTADVLRLVIGRTARLLAAGLAVGLVGALATTRLLTGFLFSVRPLDPATFVAVPAVLAAAAVLASLVPARRAARVDPAVALRYE